MEIYFVLIVCLFTTAAAQSECGMTEFYDPTGNITSPNFPDFYTNNLDCDYNIYATETSSILITFTRFIVQESQDFVTISCPTNSDFPSEVFTGTSLPNPVFIPMCSHALINFRTDDEFTNMGFRIEYNVTDLEASTAAETTESEQTTQELSTLPEVTSEAATTELEETTLQFTTAQETTLLEAVTTDAVTTAQETTLIEAVTTVAITTDQETTLQVVTTESELTTEGLTTAVQETTLEDATTEVEHTSREISTAADITSAAATTDFIQTTNSEAGITQNPDCGDTSYYGPTGVISSPNYPFLYGPNLDCYYYVHASTGSSITFIFKAFSTEPHLDTVTISCETNSSFTPIVYSGNVLPYPVSISWCSLGLVHFQSDDTTFFTGFSLNYYVSYGGCGNTLFNETQGFVTSPNYPSDYGFDQSCINIIWSPQRTTFHLNFLSFFLHSCCDCDWLEVRCLDNLEYGPYKYCGTNNYGSMDIDQCSQLQLWFNSDSSLVAQGFNIEYAYQAAVTANVDDGSVDIQLKSPALPGGHELNSPRADVCGSGSSDNSSGVITSPNYPNDYPDNRKCTHYINATTGSSIALVFEHFDVELDKDYITISCETNASFTERRYTGHTIPQPLSVPWCSQGNFFFFTDSVAAGFTGFSVDYYISEGGCGNTVYTESMGNVTSPNYPSEYGNFHDCYNIVWAPEPSHFHLEFVDFAVQGSEPCSLDWVEISCYDNNPSYKHRFCGSIAYPVDFYQCTQLLVWFHTDNITVARGFALEYNAEAESVCGDESYNEPWGNISSPNYPGFYNNSLYCEYNIYTKSSDDSSSIAIVFNEFLTEKCCDFVTISCATNSSYTPVEHSGYWTNLSVSIPWCSQGTVSFRTDITMVLPGFNLEYFVSEGGCGETLYAGSSGSISSPNYPGNYGENQNCSNIIYAAKAVSFTINFIYMDVEDCCDHVEISCLDNPTYGTHRFRGTTIPPTQTIPDCTQVLIWFFSDITTVFGGFDLEYQQTPGSNKH